MKPFLLLTVALILVERNYAARSNLDFRDDLSLEASVDCEVRTVVAQGIGQTHSILHRCMTYSDEEADGAEDMVYDLPDWLLTKYAERLESAAPTMYLRIHGGKIDRENDMIIAKESAKVEVSDDPFRWSTRRMLAPSSTGTSSVLLVRVTTNDASVSLSAKTISDRFFGSFGTPQTTFSDCSFGKLRFVPAAGPDLTGGVVEVFVNIGILGKTMTKVENAIVTELTNKVGSISHLQHVIYCVPGGSIFASKGSRWFGYAYINNQRSFFNDKNCGYLSMVAHEIGHNLGLGHSGEGDSEYGDQSGISK